MSGYYNKIILNDLFSKSNKNSVKYKINTEIGRFYFYFKKEGELKVSGKLIFFPNENPQIVEKD